MKYAISYTDASGRRVENQIFTAENVGTHLRNLEYWGCKDIVVQSIQAKTYRVRLYDKTEDRADYYAEFQTKEDLTLEQVEEAYNKVREAWYEDNEPYSLMEYLQDGLRAFGIYMTEIEFDDDFIW